MDLEITWSKVSWLWIRAHSLTHSHTDEFMCLYTDLVHGSCNAPIPVTAAHPASSTHPPTSGEIWALVWPVLAVTPHVCHHKWQHSNNKYREWHEHAAWKVTSLDSKHIADNHIRSFVYMLKHAAQIYYLTLLSNSQGVSTLMWN